MLVRPAVSADLDEILRIYAAAKAFMDASGNPTQWVNGYPGRSLLEADIRQGQCYVCQNGDQLCGVFVLALGEDPSYQVIEDGAWLNDRPYGTIHRLGSDGSCPGVFRAALAFSRAVIPDLRIDTHRDNHVMQHLIVSSGFRRCGIIHTCDDHTPRIAYQLLP